MSLIFGVRHCLACRQFEVFLGPEDLLKDDFVLLEKHGEELGVSSAVNDFRMQSHQFCRVDTRRRRATRAKYVNQLSSGSPKPIEINPNLVDPTIVRE